MATSDTKRKSTKFFDKPSSIFNVSKDWFDNLDIVDSETIPKAETDALFKESKQENTSTTPSLNTKPQNENSSTAESSLGLSCKICNVMFQTVLDQREHFRQDWHRINLQCKIKGLAPVTEEAFDELLENLSIKSDESVDEFKLVVSKLGLDGDMLASEAVSDSDVDEKTIPSSPIHWIKTKTDSSLSVGIYRSIIDKPDDSSSFSLNIESSLKKHKSSLWAFVMLGGGHFAAAIIDNSKFDFRNSKPHLFAHKTFKRYTVRRKQGGAQSGNDNSKGKAKSAGAQIRRQMEIMLREDIKELFHTWSSQFELCSRIFYRASGNNHKLLFDTDSIPFSYHDSRVHTIPFTTKRPALKEITKIYLELIRVKISQNEIDFSPSEKSVLSSLASKTASLTIEERIRKSPNSPKDTKLMKENSNYTTNNSPEQSETLVLTPTVSDLDSIDQLVTWLQTEDPLHATYDPDSFIRKLDTNKFLLEVPNFRLTISKGNPTLLHLACESGHSTLVQKLLDRGCDPSLKTGEDFSTAYSISKTKATKVQFRLYRYQHPVKYNWDLAQVPIGISPEEHKAKAESQRAKQKAKNQKKASKPQQPEIAPTEPKSYETTSVIYRSLAGGFGSTSNKSTGTGFSFGFGSLKSSNSPSPGFGTSTGSNTGSLFGSRNLGFGFGNQAAPEKNNDE